VKAGKGPRPGDSHDWKLWCQFAHKSGQDSLLSRMQSDSWQHGLEREYLFLSFAAALRDGEFHGGRHVACRFAITYFILI